jgi:rod shape-determining protein MreD
LKRAAALLGLGMLAPMLQGALAPFVPAGLCPDLSLLVVIGIGLAWRSTPGGMLVAVTVGFVADLLSGSLLGQHALMHLLAFAAARQASSHVDLRGPGPQVIFAALWCAFDGAAMHGLTAFFSPGIGVQWLDVGSLVVRSCVDGVAAPFVVALVSAVALRTGDEDGRRSLRLEPRRYGA